MTRIVIVGAPSLTGEAVAQALAAQFSAEDFPLTVEIENRMPFPIPLTEAGGIVLGHVADLGSAKGSGEFKTLGQMVRCLTSIEQLAEHHGFPEALVLHFADRPNEPPLLDPSAPIEPVSEPVDGPVEGAEIVASTMVDAATEQPLEVPEVVAAVAPRRGRPPRNP